MSKFPTFSRLGLLSAPAVGFIVHFGPGCPAHFGHKQWPRLDGTQRRIFELREERCAVWGSIREVAGRGPNMGK